MRSRSAVSRLICLAVVLGATFRGAAAESLDVRQDTLGATEALTPTATILSPVTQSGDSAGTPLQTALQPAETVNIADQIGLIMPSPWTNLYVGEYRLGYQIN